MKMMKKKALTVSKQTFNLLQKEIAIMKKIVDLELPDSSEPGLPA